MTTIQNYISAAERAGYLERQDCSGYPCLALTNQGRDVIYNTEPIRLPLEEKKAELPRKAAKKSSVPAAASDQPYELITVLTALRNKIADAEHLPRFQILNNAVLQELADRMPETIEEAADIPGIGPAKLRRIVPAMLEAIKLWKIASKKR